MTDQPSDLLTAAAQRLRDRATAATPGPWRAGDTHLGQFGYTATVLADRENLNETDLVAWLPSMSQTPWDPERNVWPTSAYIALMHPAVGLALAKWLEREAEIWAQCETVKAQIAPQGFKLSWGISTHDEALAVARAVLGQDGGQR